MIPAAAGGRKAVGAAPLEARSRGERLGLVRNLVGLNDVALKAGVVERCDGAWARRTSGIRLSVNSALGTETDSAKATDRHGMTYRSHLPQLDGDPFLTDGGSRPCLIFQEGIDLPLFAAFDLREERGGEGRLRRYYDRRRAGRERGVGFVLESPTWRASPGGRASSATTRTSSTRSTGRRSRSWRRSRTSRVRPAADRDQRLHRTPGRRLQPRGAALRGDGPDYHSTLDRNLRRDRGRHGHGAHDDVLGGGDRHRERPPTRDSRRRSRSRSRRTAGCRAGRGSAMRSRRWTPRPVESRVLHDQLRPPDALRGVLEGGGVWRERSSRPAGQCVDQKPRRARRGDRAR